MLPKKELNIYPKTEENVKALINFYFDDYNLDRENAIENVMEYSNLSLNQFEFLARKLSESYIEIFKPFFVGGKTSVSNLFRYGIDALTKNEEEWSFGPYSSGHQKVKEFLEFVKRTETDYNYLEENN